MRVVPGLLVMGFSLTMIMTPTFAATFDGKWIADIPPQGQCNITSTMTLLVSGDAISGQVHNAAPNDVGNFTGTVDQDGNATFLVNNHYPGTMKFTADHFEANWQNNKCSRHAEGDREKDSAQNTAIAATRKQYQDKFDDLVKRAEAGDKGVDYTALRAAYVYTENWDYFGNKTIPLMQQAQVAQKGGDCTTALNKLDDVIKFDFTVDSAHSLLSDCLEDGNRDKARVESAIAYGLVNSLMDSGDGDSEKTAYVVNTQREEMDVLANRHIQLRTRQTQVRGSDGHYYDQIQGISLRGGGASIKTVFFNVDSFVAGRESKRAAIAVAAASIH